MVLSILLSKGLQRRGFVKGFYQMFLLKAFIQKVCREGGFVNGLSYGFC
jgi:hypothetical protein